jgi:cytochrome P450
MPGDHRFRRVVRDVDDIIYPLVAEARRSEPGVERDIISVLARAKDADGNGLSDRELRDDMFSMFAAGTETTALALTWFLVLLDLHPEVGMRVRAEIQDAVGAGPVTAEHLPRLSYTRMALEETLRVRPLIWFLPRTAREADHIGGVRIPKGATVILSPYLTHRLASIWDRPEEFDPERFSPDRSTSRDRYAFIPFGGGAHLCIGNHFFMVEAQVILATLLSQLRPSVINPTAVRARAAVTLRPRNRIRLRLRPVD